MIEVERPPHKRSSAGKVAPPPPKNSDDDDDDDMLEVEPPPPKRPLAEEAAPPSPKRPSAEEADAARFSWEKHVSAPGAGRRLQVELASHSVAEERVVASVFGEAAGQSATAEELLLQRIQHISRRNASDKLRSLS
jgi:hypothetical protein